MNSMLKTFIAYGLSFLFFSAAFHVDHYHSLHDGYSICDISCDDEKHHFISYQCEKCLNKNNRLIIQECINFLYNEYKTAFFSINASFNETFIPFNLYSRPPPSLI